MRDFFHIESYFPTSMVLAAQPFQKSL